MEHQKINKSKAAATDLIRTQDLNSSIESLLKNAQDGIIASDSEGNIIAINKKAALLFANGSKKFINQNLWQLFKLNSFSHKRQFILARKQFLLAQEGVAQQFNWIERKAEKPIIAYNIMMNKTEIQGSSVVFIIISDILHEKITEWVLWSLAKIGNHHEINGVIDETLKLANDVFSTDYAVVSLINKQRIAHSVSYFYRGEKIENINYPLANSPSEMVHDSNSILCFNEVQNKFPQDQLLKEMDINSYLGGPITNSQEQVVGLMTVLKKKEIIPNSINNTLFRLFLARINLEIERLLNQRKLQFLASIPQQDPNPVIRIFPDGEVIFANTQGKILLKYWNDIFLGLPDSLLKDINKAKTTDQVVRIELEADNKTYLLTLIWIPDFKQINIYGTDITQLKTTEQDMLNLARFDALTQIANRQYFEEILLEKIHDHLLSGTELALLLIDLDDFKIINDTLGHPMGDLLLKAATKRMVYCLRQNDFIARLGGDEFIVLLNQTNTHSAIQVAEKIISILSKNFKFGEYHLKITASIGIAVYPEAGLTPSYLLKNTDIAMYQAKKEGKNHYTVFSKSLHFLQDKRNEIIRRDLKLAALKNQLYIDYQPQFDINSNKIIGIEALLRWLHPTQGLIVPDEFISLAEQTGAIQMISQWLIEQSLQDFAQILILDPTAKLSINVSLSQLNDARFLDSLCDNIIQHNINKDRIILDISERIIAPHFKKIAKKLLKINNIGLELSLDNFGSPQISLPKLLALPINYLKLDQLLLDGIINSPKHQLLYKGVINLSKDLKLKVIQKGVETIEQHQIVKSQGCEFAQGYYYCQPLQLEPLKSFITAHYSL